MTEQHTGAEVHAQSLLPSSIMVSWTEDASPRCTISAACFELGDHLATLGCKPPRHADAV
jgi:hypothetical protein